jgi:hypothetical protein
VRRRQLVRLRRAVSGATYAWGDVLRWTEENDREHARLDRRFGSILSTVPPSVRPALERVIAG